MKSPICAFWSYSWSSISKHCGVVRAAAFSLATLCAMVLPTTVQAVPSFARQTGLACSACHTVYPELTAFGRTFKLNGYTITGLKQIQQQPGSDTGGLKINEIPPLSVMLQVGMTHLRGNQAGAQNNSIEFPQALSLYYAGEISPHMGAFLQMTYSQPDNQFGFDMADVRYANHGTLGGKDVVYGITVNNGPGMGDLWNGTPAWTFPYLSSDTAPTPNADVEVNQLMMQGVAGLGAYALWDNHLYGNVTLYRSAAMGQGAPTASSMDTVDNVAPFWRFAWQQHFGDDYLELGTYGLHAKLYPMGISGNTYEFTDNALDAQYEMPFGNDLLTLHAIYIHENQHVPTVGHDTTLNQLRINGNYHWGNEALVALGYFSDTGDSNKVLYEKDMDGNVVDASGSPDSNGWIAQATYLPRQNVKLSLQYTAYTKFNGASSNYDGTGRSASDNNTLYLNSWFMW